MSTQKSKFELFQRLQNLGFTYEEAAQLRRIEMTLQRWAEHECGDEHGRCIERDETTGKPYMTYDKGRNGERGRYRIADREAGALKRLARIVAARNARAYVDGQCVNPVAAYHQGDCRGCALYIVSTSDLAPEFKAWKAENSGANAAAFPFHKHLGSLYTRGLAVCA